jgi:hypothetical protein
MVPSPDEDFLSLLWPHFLFQLALPAQRFGNLLLLPAFAEIASG